MLFRSGVSIYSTGLSADKTLTEGDNIQLYFNDVETNLGGIVTASGSLAAGSTFTIASGKAGRYRVDLTVGIQSTGTLASTWQVDGWITVNNVEKERVTKDGTVTGLSSPATSYRSFTVTFIGYFREGATIECFAKHVSSSVGITSIKANAIDKTSTSGEDTTFTITKI